MKQAAKALGWAIKVFWILIIAFSVTSVYSALNVRIGFKDPQTFISDESVIFSIPLVINNTGFYDLSELNISANVIGDDGSPLSSSTTFVSSIPRGSVIETNCNITIDVADIISKEQKYLFNDTLFQVNMSARLNFARTIPFQVSTNMTIPWGAPLHNLSVGQFSYYLHNLTHQRIVVPLYFENHSPYFDIDGNIQMEIQNSRGETIGQETVNISAPSLSQYSNQFELYIETLKLTPSGKANFFFETNMFILGPVVISYG